MQTVQAKQRTLMQIDGKPLERKCSNCGASAKRYAHYCDCGTKLPPATASVVRLCGKCGAAIPRYARACATCGADKQGIVLQPRSADSTRRQAAECKLLAGMRGPACVCGLRGPHECTRTREWAETTMARLISNAQARAYSVGLR